jgi:hypothetical protein
MDVVERCASLLCPPDEHLVDANRRPRGHPKIQHRDRIRVAAPCPRRDCIGDQAQARDRPLVCRQGARYSLWTFGVKAIIRSWHGLR